MKHRDEKTEAANGAAASHGSRRTTMRLWAELLKTCLFIFAALAVIVIGSIAWFAANTRVQSGTASISAKNEMIRLATKGNRQSSEEEWLNLRDGEPYPYDVDTYYYTVGERIALRLSEEYVVSPGASGSISFYIIPTQDGAMHVTLYLGLAGYAESTDPGGTTQVSRVADDVLDALLSGHILLFHDYADGHYSGWLGTGTAGMLSNAITVTLPDTAQANVPFEVTLYWIWPLRYENMVDDLYAQGNAEYAAQFKPFVEAQASELTVIPEASKYSYSRIFLTGEKALSTTDSRSRAYNLADEYIGTNADYLYLTIQLTPYNGETAE